MDLIDLFKEYGDKQEILSKLREDKLLRTYNSSELHIIAAIGDLEQPNVTSLAEYLRMTRGGISKNVKKLIDAGLIVSYQLDGNTKNIYYRLTDYGKDIYEKHSEAHEAWIRRDRNFIEKFPPEQLRMVEDFMKKYIQHIDNRIEESEEHGEDRQ